MFSVYVVKQFVCFDTSQQTVNFLDWSSFFVDLLKYTQCVYYSCSRCVCEV